MTYEFKTIEEFVSYLDTRAKEFRNHANHAHPRTHTHVMRQAAANEIEHILAIVRLSNITVLSPADIKKIAAHT